MLVYPAAADEPTTAVCWFCAEEEPGLLSREQAKAWFAAHAPGCPYGDGSVPEQ